MSNKKPKLNSIWDLTVREEIMTILSGILTVLLLDSGHEILYYIGWLTGAWTLLCLIGIFRSVWPKSIEKTAEKIAKTMDRDLIATYLYNNFTKDEFIVGTEKQQTEHINKVADAIYGIMKKIYKEGIEHERCRKENH